MNLFGLSPGELLLIMMVAMVVLGPEKLPEVAASLGKWIREFRRATEELTAQFADNNPIYELQRAFSLTDDPVPAAPAEESAQTVAPADSTLSAPEPVSVPAPAPLASTPPRSDYFNFPQMYPSVSDLWVHGSLPDLARHNGHATFDVRPIADEWTF
ncbi:MAG: twin-arginine translocase TatA/TatE family subunit, partial [Candidatus Dormibacteraceae bacterium]